MMPFTKSTVWGIQRGWGERHGPVRRPSFRLALGSYTMTETITPPFRKVLGLPDATSSATVTVKVVKGPPGPAGERGFRPMPAGRFPGCPAVRTLTNPPRAALPDMVPLPSWGIQLEITHKNNGSPGR